MMLQPPVIYAPAGSAMVTDYGFNRDNVQPVLVVDLGCGAGKMQCAECEGTGDWGRFYPDDLVVDDTACVVCKGQGWHLVSV